MVNEFDTDIGLAAENHARFPCAESAQLLRELTLNPSAADQHISAKRKQEESEQSR